MRGTGRHVSQWSGLQVGRIEAYCRRVETESKTIALTAVIDILERKRQMATCQSGKTCQPYCMLVNSVMLTCAPRVAIMRPEKEASTTRLARDRDPAQATDAWV